MPINNLKEIESCLVITQRNLNLIQNLKRNNMARKIGSCYAETKLDRYRRALANGEAFKTILKPKPNHQKTPKSEVCFNKLKAAAAKLPTGMSFNSLKEFARAIGYHRRTVATWVKGMNYEHPDIEMRWRMIFSNRHSRKQLTFEIK